MKFVFWTAVFVILGKELYSQEIQLEQFPFVECGANLTAANGSFVSPNFPAADNSLDCKWMIRSTATNQIRLVLFNFNTELNSDYVYVHDGEDANMPILMVHSGSVDPVPIRSSGHSMLVRFTTNNKNSSRGFEANYYSIPQCSYLLNGSMNGSFSSPNYPNVYDNNINCKWIIRVPEPQAILVNFVAVATESDYDYIQVHDGPDEMSPLLQRLSGNMTNTRIQSTSSSLYVHFVSDKSITSAGFLANYTATTKVSFFEENEGNW